MEVTNQELHQPRYLIFRFVQNYLASLSISAMAHLRVVWTLRTNDNAVKVLKCGHFQNYLEVLDHRSFQSTLLYFLLGYGADA